MASCQDRPSPKHKSNTWVEQQTGERQHSAPLHRTHNEKIGTGIILDGCRMAQKPVEAKRLSNPRSSPIPRIHPIPSKPALELDRQHRDPLPVSSHVHGANLVSGQPKKRWPILPQKARTPENNKQAYCAILVGRCHRPSYCTSQISPPALLSKNNSFM